MNNRNSQLMNRNSSSSAEQQQTQTFSRELLATVWQRMGQMSSTERNILINHLRSIESEQNSASLSLQETEGNTLRIEPQSQREGRRQLFNITSSPREGTNNEYIDFRLYPITIDWNKIENGESYYYNLFILYGYFGVGVITSLLKIQKKFRFAIESLYQIVLEYYSSLATSRQDAALAEFISLLPSLKQIHEVLKYNYYSTKELPLIKLILDVYENYLFCYHDQLQIELRKEYIAVANLFYLSMRDDCDLQFIQDEFSKHKKLMGMINSFKMFQFKTRDCYLEHVNDLEIDYQSLLKGTSENMFIL